VARFQSVATRFVRLDRTTENDRSLRPLYRSATCQFEFADAPFASGAGIRPCTGAEKFEFAQFIGRQDGRGSDLGTLGN